MVTTLHYPQLPWTPREEDQRRFRRVSRWVLGLACILAVVVPYVPLPIQEQEPEPELPTRVVRILVGAPTPGSVEAPSAVPSPSVVPETEPAEVVPAVPEPAAPDLVPEVPPATAEVPPAAPPADTETSRAPTQQPAIAPGATEPSAGRRSAEPPGVLALQDTLAALRTRASDLTAGVGRADRDTAAAPASSPGRVDLSLAARDEATAGSRVDIATPSPVAIARLERPSALPAPRAASQPNAAVAQPSARESRAVGVWRSQEEIQEVLDRHKGALYALYNRELESDPSLQGRVVLSLTISPSGNVTDCRVTASELDSSAFQSKLVQRMRAIDFGPKPEAPTVTTTVPIEFLPV